MLSVAECGYTCAEQLEFMPRRLALGVPITTSSYGEVGRSPLTIKRELPVAGKCPNWLKML
jgi:hypothetical protein